MFILYFMVCQWGIIDIAKRETIKNNYRLNGILVCVVITTQQIMLALFYERYIKDLVSSPALGFIVDSFSNIMCYKFLYDSFKSEQEEVINIKLSKNMKVNR